jgi:hypothetical protein
VLNRRSLRVFNVYFPSENPRIQTRNYSYTSTLAFIRKITNMKQTLLIIALFIGLSNVDAQTIRATTSIRMSVDREDAISNTPDPVWAGTLEKQADGIIKIYFRHFSIGTHDFVITTGSDDDHMMHTSYLGLGYVVRCELIYLRESGVSNQYEGLYKSEGGRYYSLLVNKVFD